MSRTAMTMSSAVVQVQNGRFHIRQAWRAGIRLRWAKRLVDLPLAGLGLLASAPLWPFVALAIKLDDGGPVFYGQRRVGKGGYQFKSWKFRSMVPDSDQHFGPLQASDGDARVTRVGRLLRATALDELPQMSCPSCGISSRAT
jgi:lipopolysaccharide/colanic/teichoic acid biosynthesis glycosyltransferase